MIIYVFLIWSSVTRLKNKAKIIHEFRPLQNLLKISQRQKLVRDMIQYIPSCLSLWDLVARGRPENMSLTRPSSLLLTRL